jgi:hypothetical protein
LAPKTLRNCHIVLRRELADAERLGLVSRRPAAAARTVAAPRAEQRTWPSEEIQRFFEALVAAADTAVRGAGSIIVLTGEGGFVVARPGHAPTISTASGFESLVPSLREIEVTRVFGRLMDNS